MTTNQQLRLMRHTAQHNIRQLDRPASPEEIAKYKAPLEAVLLFFAALNIAISDVRDEFEQAGLYRHDVKRNLNNAEKLIFQTYTSLYHHFQRVEHKVSRESYDIFTLMVSDAIDDCILLLPPKRSFNIAIALARLITELNDNMGRFVVPEALPMRHVVKYLERIKAVEDHHIDMIIALKLKEMMEKSQRGEL